MCHMPPKRISEYLGIIVSNVTIYHISHAGREGGSGEILISHERGGGVLHGSHIFSRDTWMLPSAESLLPCHLRSGTRNICGALLSAFAVSWSRVRVAPSQYEFLSSNQLWLSKMSKKSIWIRQNRTGPVATFCSIHEWKFIWFLFPLMNTTKSDRAGSNLL